MGFFILLGGVSFSKEQICYIFTPLSSIPATTTEVNESDLPLPIPSTITTERDHLRLDLERVSVHKYYIVYSVIYGDQSHTAYNLYLTDLTKKNLKPDEIEEIWLETKKGERIKQIAESTIYGYPEDQPLGWKIGIIAKFPYQSSRQEHKLYFRYQGKVFELKDIQY